MLQRQQSVYARSTYTQSIAPPQKDSADNLENGVIFQYFKGDFTQVPEFAHLTPDAIGITPSLVLDSFSEVSFCKNTDLQPEGNFALELSCFIQIPFAATWILSASSNDGSVVSLAGKRLIVNDHVHYATKVTGIIF